MEDDDGDATGRALSRRAALFKLLGALLGLLVVLASGAYEIFNLVQSCGPSSPSPTLRPSFVGLDADDRRALARGPAGSAVARRADMLDTLVDIYGAERAAPARCKEADRAKDAEVFARARDEGDQATKRAVDKVESAIAKVCFGGEDASARD